MTDEIKYKSAFVNELSDVLAELMSTIGDGMNGIMGMLVNAMAPEIPDFLQALDDNPEYLIMFGVIIKKLHTAALIDDKARQAYMDQFTIVSNEVEQAEDDAMREGYEAQNEEDE